MIIAAGAASAAAPSWVNPTGGDVVRDSVTLNVSDSDNDPTGEYDFYYQNSTGAWVEISTGVTDGGNFTTTSWDTTVPGNGDYTLNVSNSSTAPFEYSTIEVTVDNADPSGDSYSPSDGGTSGESPTVSFSADGTGSSVAQNTMWVFDSDDNLEESDETTSLDLSDLDHEETYTVTYFLEDEAGNTNGNSSWTFTADTQYEGGDITLPENDDNEDQYIQAGDDDEYDFDVDVNTGDEDSVTVTCKNEDDDTLGTDTVDSDGTATCEIDMEDYSGKQEIYVEPSDGHGNTGDDTDTKTYYFDTEDPGIERPDLPAETFSKGFEIELKGDDESGLSEAEYYFDEDTDEGEGNVVDFESGDSITVNLSSLEGGDHTVYFRVKDRAGRWSPEVERDFSYVPGADPRISLRSKRMMEVEAGSSKELEVELANTGKLMIRSTEVSVSGGPASGTETVEDLEPGESRNVSFDISTSESDLGEHTINLELSRPSKSREIALTVTANQQQRTDIEQKLETYRNRLGSVESNSSELGVSGDLQDMLESNVSDLRSSVEEADAAVGNDKYYEAEQALQGVEDEYSSATRAISDVKEIKKQRGFRRLLVAGGAVVLVAFVGVGAFFYRSDEYDLHLERLLNSDISVDSLNGLKARIRAIFKDEAEAEEFEWNGFQ